MTAGQIDFYNGRMNGGKTSRLIIDAYAVDEGGSARAIVLAPEAIKTDDGLLTARSGITRQVDGYLAHDDFPSERIEKIAANLGERCLKAVFVDEAQFLSPDQVHDLARYANENHAVDVRAYGLRTDYKLELFPGSKALFEVSNPVSLDAKCYTCGSPNPFLNARLVNGTYNFDPTSEITAVNGIGGTTYITECLDCITPKIIDAHENGYPIARAVLRVAGIIT